MGTKGKIIITVGILIFFGFLFVIALGERGAVDLYQLKLDRDRLHGANLELQEKNQALYRAIRRLKHDLDFVENIARTELGMIEKDEVVILKKKR
ncbi:MAG: septum formation initiator family protein [Desulfobacterales bacterium]|nr:septum formation initiator family protein [Desulfobacterales bacterium]